MKRIVLLSLIAGFASPVIPSSSGSLAPALRAQSQALRQMERLGRGVVAVRQDASRVFISWRLIGSDTDQTAFNLYRSTGTREAARLNDRPIADVTHFVDSTADLTQANRYYVRPVLRNREEEPSAGFTLAANSAVRQYLSIPLQTPNGYTPNDASAGDLDGDGEYEIVLHQTGRGFDNSQNGVSDPPILEAYKLDGTLLWRINLGRNIREGAHYTQFMVYDLDGDGRAEVACKTADGTVDGKGKVIGDAGADYVSRQQATLGRILEGPEYLTVFDGLTGAALATVDYVPARGNLAGWGLNGRTDSIGNRSDRFLAAVAYLDGVRPSLIMCRGYYGRSVLAAWDWRDGKLQTRWVFDSSQTGLTAYSGQGNHNLSVADVDGDGKDEIVYGSMVIDDNGRGLYSTGLGHGDALHVSDLDPARPGLEVWGIHEDPGATRPGTALFSARTGEVYWARDYGRDVGRGLAADIDPRHPGAEMWGGADGLMNAKGERISDSPRSTNFAIWWDGDLLREILDGVRISKWDWQSGSLTTLLNAENSASNNGTKSTPALSADIIGDWREEAIFRTTDNRELRIYTTTIPTTHRVYTLMHDPQYRLSVAWQNVAYNQPPHLSFFLGEGMVLPLPQPFIRILGTR
jgi:rhamnogalacturonan endolyase